MATGSDQQPDDEQTEFMAEQERLGQLLDNQIAQLMEHGGFDSVHVTVTRFNRETGRTGARTRGDGNWYARFASVKEWVIKEEEQMRIEQRPSADD